MTAWGRSNVSVLPLIAAEPALAGDKPAVGGWLQRLCRAAARELDALGVGVSLVSDEGVTAVMAASSPRSERIENVQFTVGEGPCLEAYSLGRPVLTSDLSQAASRQWPGYAGAAHEHGVRAVFAFPLQLGAVRMGALDVYRDRTGSLSDHSLRQALAFAEAAMTAVLETHGSQGWDQEGDRLDRESDLDSLMEGSLVVYQAQGVVRMQLGVSLAEAMLRLRAYAYAHGRPLRDVAQDVMARRVTFESDD